MTWFYLLILKLAALNIFMNDYSIFDYSMDYNFHFDYNFHLHIDYNLQLQNIDNNDYSIFYSKSVFLIELLIKIFKTVFSLIITKSSFEGLLFVVFWGVGFFFAKFWQIYHIKIYCMPPHWILVYLKEIHKYKRKKHIQLDITHREYLGSHFPVHRSNSWIL